MSSPSQPRARRAQTPWPPRPTTGRAPRAGLLISFVLHAALIAATWFTWHRMMEMSPSSHVVPVELVVSEQTNMRAQAPPPQPEKPVAPQAVMEEPALPDFAQAEAAPEPMVPQFRIVEPKPVTAPPRDIPKTRKQMLQDADAVLNKILAQTQTPKNARAGTRVLEGAGQQNQATADLADALKSQIYKCWTPPVGAPNAADLVVDFQLLLNPDGTVAGRPQLSGGLRAGNPYTRAAAEAAIRAIYQCAPYNLPRARYTQWREIDPLRFDPREMMGQ